MHISQVMVPGIGSPPMEAHWYLNALTPLHERWAPRPDQWYAHRDWYSIGQAEPWDEQYYSPTGRLAINRRYQHTPVSRPARL